MTKEQIYHLTETAYKNNELIKLFLGEEPYKFDNLKHIPANVATDIGALISEGIYKLYNNGYQEVLEVFKKAIYTLFNGTPVEIWTAYSIVWSQHWEEQHNHSPLKIIDENLLLFCRKQIYENEDALKECRALVGWNLQDGLWDDIQGADASLKKRFGKGVL